MKTESKIKTAVEVLKEELTESMVELLVDTPHFEEFVIDAIVNYHDQFQAKFEMPTDNQLIKVAILFNDGKVDMAQLTNMVSMCQFVVDRLFENGNVMVPSSKEKI